MSHNDSMFYVTNVYEADGMGISGCVGCLPVFESFGAALSFADGNEDAIGVLLQADTNQTEGAWVPPSEAVRLTATIGVYGAGDEAGQTCSNVECRACGARWAAMVPTFTPTDALECVQCGAFDTEAETVVSDTN
jgi:hypothetical protein